MRCKMAKRKLIVDAGANPATSMPQGSISTYQGRHIMNTNCLEGMACPKCKSEGPFDIVATCLARVDDDGVEDAVEYEWTSSSLISCTTRWCHWRGTVREAHRG